MSADLQERRTRAERKIKELLSAMDSNVEQLYLSLLNHDSEKDTVNESQEVQRLEGFHDYIVVRELTGVHHPSLEDFLLVREENPEKLISFGTGKRKTVEYDEDELETVPDEELSALAESGEIEILGGEEDEVEDFEPAEDVEENPVDEYKDIVEETIVKEHEHDLDLKKELVVEAPVVEEKKEEHVTARSFFGEEKEDNAVEDTEEKKTVEDEEAEVNAKAGRLTRDAIISKDFSNKMGGYNKDAVDDFLDSVVAFMENSHSAEEYAEMIDKMRATTFKKEKLRSGFLVAEVDGFKEAIIGELEVLKLSI